MKRVITVLLSILLLTVSLVPAAASSAVMGDVNGDGKINIRDLGILIQYLNDYDVAADLSVSDFNGDGTVNLVDAAVLQRYLNGWDVSLTPPESVLTPEERTYYQSIVDSENAWLASTQLSNGALPMTPTTNGKVRTNPYFADFAALSLLNQPELYADVVKKYMDWHFDHLNTAVEDPYGVEGTIFDYTYTVTNGVVTMEEWIVLTPTYDSVDSYAATFLMVLQKYAEKTGDTAYILANADHVERVISALMAMMDNGLTLGKPNSPVKMLMDNCEVYAGLQAAAKLYNDVLVPAGMGTAMRTLLQRSADKVAAAIERDMWTGQYYHTALNQDGTVFSPFSWAEYYPSATAQLFPMLHGVLGADTERARTLYAEFCRRYDWENLNHPDAYVWSSNAYTAAVMGDYARVGTFLTAYNDMVTASRGFPLYNGDAAWACMTAYYMTQLP